MITNYPIPMKWKEDGWSKHKEVLVYDFLHDNETFQSCGLCWVPTMEAWATVPVPYLTPSVESSSTKKLLTEGDVTDG